MTSNNTIRRVVRNIRKAFTEGFVDDHGTAAERVIPSAIVLFVRGVGAEVSVCPLEEGENQCLNPLYMHENGEVHLSTASCGGNLRARGVSLEMACEKYNQEHSFTASVENGAQFSQVILIRKADYIKKFGL